MLSLALFILAQTPTPVPQPPSSNPLFMLIPMVAIFYFLLIRPQQKRAKELAATIASLKTGDRVITTGGIHGTVANIKDGPVLMLKIADNVKIEVDKSAIATVDRSGATPVPAAKS